MAEQYVITELRISDVRVTFGAPHPERTPIGPFDSREAAFEYAHQMQRRYGDGGGSVEVGTLVPPITRPASPSEPATPIEWATPERTSFDSGLTDEEAAKVAANARTTREGDDRG